MAALATATDTARLTMDFQVSGRRGTAGPPPGRTPVTTSFPSGHAAAAAAFATGVGLEMPALPAPVGALAAAVGISRVVNGVHYPSDIAGG
jgi:membrane-associated phospholipid phosphatase